MTNPNLTLIGFLIDRSGSMSSCREDMEGGINTTVSEQAKQPGQAEVAIAQFDTEYETVLPPTPIDQVKPYRLVPRGGTALLDGIGKFVVELGENLSNRAESARPGKVIVCIVTDGYENSSREWTGDKVKELVKRQQDEYQWEFIFLGANIDAIATGGDLGLARGSTMDFDSSSTVATAAAYGAVSNYMTTSRAGGQASFSEEERKQSMSSK